MADQTLLGVFSNPDGVADAVSRLRSAGYDDYRFEVVSGTPYPEGTFGERPMTHKLFIFPLIGALCGFSVGLLITAGTQLSFPMVTGGKPLLAIPPMLIIMYEGTMLGAILFTVVGLIFESRMPNLNLGVYDPRITAGHIGLVVAAPEDRARYTEQLLREAGADDIKTG